MKSSIAKSLVTLIATGWLLLGATVSLQAKKIEFPENDPAFTFNLPDGWATESGPDGRIYCTAPDGFKFGIVASPGVTDEDNAKKLLPKVLKSMADAMKCENYKGEEVKTGKIGGLSLVGMKGHCKSDGTEMSLNAVVFSLTPGKYFSIVGAATKENDKAHNKDMNDIIASIAAAD